MCLPLAPLKPWNPNLTLFLVSLCLCGRGLRLLRRSVYDMKKGALDFLRCRLSQCSRKEVIVNESVEEFLLVEESFYVCCQVRRGEGK